MSQMRATMIGFIAVLLWSLLALFTVETAPVPPLQLTAICFFIGGAIGLIWTGLNGDFRRLLKINWRIYAFGKLLGVASYAAPLLSTFVLMIAGIAKPTWALLIAAILITLGAALAARASTTISDKNR